jgi:hypothetical protein
MQCTEKQNFMGGKQDGFVQLKGMSAPHIPNAKHPSQPAQTFQLD